MTYNVFGGTLNLAQLTMTAKKHGRNGVSLPLLLSSDEKISNI